MDQQSTIFENLEEFDNHRLISFVYDPKTQLRGFIAIHRGGSIPAFGATRFWHYAEESLALKDAIRLARLMSYKSAMAGLAYGGAKGVIFAAENYTPEEKENLIRAYAKKVNMLGGSFVTGSDVGLNDDDVKIMAQESTYIVGTECDPVKYTVRGVYAGILESLKSVFGTDSLRGRTIAIQGLGKTGWGLLELVAKDAEKVHVFDIDEKKVKAAKEKFPNVVPVSEEELISLTVDIFSPCALGGTVSLSNAEKLQCKIIAGSANNQLENQEAGRKLFEKGILYAPDYIINAGGLIAVVDEYDNHGTDEERVMKQVERIRPTLAKVLAKSKEDARPVSDVADEIAESIFNTIQ